MLLSLHLFLTLFSYTCSLAENKFQKLLSKPYFIDKTLLLETFLSPETPPYFYISQPRRFGKTLNLAMLEKFFKFQVDPVGIPLPYNDTEAYRIFKELKIGKNRDLLVSQVASYPVLSFSLLRIAKRTHKHTIASLNSELGEAMDNIVWNKFLKRFYQFHKDLFAATSERDLKFLGKLNKRKLNRHEIGNAIFVLCRLLYHYFGKTPVIVLIDDYDEAALNSYEYGNSNITLAYDLINNMIMKAINQGPKYIRNIVISGVTTLAYSHRDFLPSKVAHFPFLDDHIFTPFYGLSRSDLFDLFQQYGCSPQERHAIRKYYKAYQTLNERTLIYNTFSLTRYFLNRDPEEPGPKGLISYWRKNEMQDQTLPMIKGQAFRHTIQDLLTNRSVRYKLTKVHPKDALFQLQDLRATRYKNSGKRATSLFFRIYFELGYLNHGDEKHIFVIPNIEVREILEQQIKLYQLGKFSDAPTTKILSWVQWERSKEDEEDSKRSPKALMDKVEADEGDPNASTNELSISVQEDISDADDEDLNSSTEEIILSVEGDESDADDENSNESTEEDVDSVQLDQSQIDEENDGDGELNYEGSSED